MGKFRRCTGAMRAAALGLLPIVYGIRAGSDMLNPLAIGVFGALTFSVLFSLVAIPTLYFFMRTLVRRKGIMTCVS
ncbi:MAG: efflux RND transporter permease subunit [Nitrospirales bacterium]